MPKFKTFVDKFGRQPTEDERRAMSWVLEDFAEFIQRMVETEKSVEAKTPTEIAMVNYAVQECEVISDIANDRAMRYRVWGKPKVEAVQWAPSGNPLLHSPNEVLRFLATGTKTHGYGYGPGWSLNFGTEHGGINVNPKQWIVKNSDGTFTVQDEDPNV